MTKEYMWILAKVSRNYGSNTGMVKGIMLKVAASNVVLLITLPETEQGSDSNNGPKYVLKEDDTQHGGDDRIRYDMLFDEDNLDDNKQTKKRKADDKRFEDPPHKNYDKHSERHRYDDGKKPSDKHRHDDGKKHLDRCGYDDKNSRNSREDRWRERSQERYRREKRSEERSRDKEHRDPRRVKSQERDQSKKRYEERSLDTEHKDHRRSSGSSRYGKNDGDYMRGSETEQHRQDGGYNMQSRDRDARERRHRDERTR